MGLASALTTALTGMQAAETQVDIAGNNLANSQTVGFKASEAHFATQFLQTQSLGSAPTDTSGGTNPRQTGLGTRVAAITPNFSQGTIEISSSPSDLAIQGDGFFIVESSEGERLYTRNGIFQTNADNELVSLTGQRVLGFGINDQYEIQQTTLVPVTIPLGTAAAVQATRNVFFQGSLSPAGDIADTAAVVQSAALGDSSVARPDGSAVATTVAPTPSSAGVIDTHTDGGGTHPEGAVYRYRFTLVDAFGGETAPSGEMPVTVPAGDTLANNVIDLGPLPSAAGYATVNIYRTADGGSDFFLLDSAAASGVYTDDNSVALSATPLDETVLTGSYSYLITFAAVGQPETRPSLVIGPQNVTNGRVEISNLPAPPAPYDTINIYRNLASDSSSFYLAGSVSPGEDFLDGRSDADISNLSTPGNQALDTTGPRIDGTTLLIDVIQPDGLNYVNAFQEGSLEFTPRKGGRSMGTKTFDITATSTVQNLLDFMAEATGIQSPLDDPANPIPGSLNNIVGESGTLAPGISIQNGQIRVVSNNGVDNAVDLSPSSFTITDSAGEIFTPNLSFTQRQAARGQSTVADFIAFDSLGTAVNVRVTAVLEELTDSTTIYRWFADSSDNSPLTGSEVAVGTGLITFDSDGNLLGTSNDVVNVQRRNFPAADPLAFTLNFDETRGLATETSNLAAVRQDGSPPGTLVSYLIGENGVIRGVFSSGITRDLGQLRLARFTNPAGLVQRGQNNFAPGINSGLPIEGDPNTNGIGSITGGAVELSNTDIGKNLIDLVLATTQYRGNARVISTAQQLLDELLNLRR